MGVWAYLQTGRVLQARGGLSPSPWPEHVARKQLLPIRLFAILVRSTRKIQCCILRSTPDVRNRRFRSRLGPPSGVSRETWRKSIPQSASSDSIQPDGPLPMARLLNRGDVSRETIAGERCARRVGGPPDAHVSRETGDDRFPNRSDPCHPLATTPDGWRGSVWAPYVRRCFT